MSSVYTYYSNAAPAVHDTLTERDAAKILEELLDAQNSAHLLGLMLNVKPRDVDAILIKYQDPKDRLYHIIIAFLGQAEPRPTWRVIVGALRSPVVNLTALARELKLLISLTSQQHVMWYLRPLVSHCLFH